MKRMIFPTSAKVALVLLSVALATSAAPKKVLIVSVTEGFPHSSVPIAGKVLTELGKKSEAFEVVDIVATGPNPSQPGAAKDAWKEKTKSALAEKMSAEALKNYDAIIFANTTGILPLP